MALIDVTQKVTTRLPNEPVKNEDGKSWKYNGLCPVNLASVELRDQTDETGEFQGITRKVLDFTFKNFKGKDTGAPDRFTTLSEKAIGQKKDENGTPVLRAEKDIIANNNEMFKRIAHILENCVSSPTYRAISTITQKDLAANFDLPGHVTEGTPGEQAIARSLAYDKFLTYLYNWFNGDGTKTKSIFLNAANEPIIHGWLKVLPAYPKKNYYAIPSWVQTGFFEYASIDKTTGWLNKPLILKIKANESLELLAANATAGPSASGMPSAQDVTPAMAAFLAQQNNQ